MITARKNIRDAVVLAVEDSSWRDVYDCLYPENDDSDHNCYFSSKNAYNSYINEVTSFFEDLPDEFYIYRSVHANSKEDVDVKFPGDFWTVNASTALNFGSHSNGNFVMRGWIRKEDIDLEQSIRAYIEFSDIGGYDSEFEITIPNAYIVVRDIEVFTNKDAKRMSEHEEFIQPRIVSESKTFPIMDYRDQKAIERVNANGGDVINDGIKYIICANRRGNDASVMSTMSKNSAEEQVTYLKSQRDIIRISVIKGSNRKEYVRLDNGSWAIGSERIMEVLDLREVFLKETFKTPSIGNVMKRYLIS